MSGIFLLIFVFTVNIYAADLPVDISAIYSPKEIESLKITLNRVEKEGLPLEYYYNKIRQAHLKNISFANLEKVLINDLEKMKEARNLLTRSSVSGQKIQNYQNSLIFLTELLQRGLEPVEFLYFTNHNKAAKIPIDELLYFLEQFLNLKQLCGFSDKTSQELTTNFYQYYQDYEPLLNTIQKITENNLLIEQHPQLTDLMNRFSQKQISWRQFTQQLKKLSKESLVGEMKK